MATEETEIRNAHQARIAAADNTSGEGLADLSEELVQRGRKMAMTPAENTGQAVAILRDMERPLTRGGEDSSASGAGVDLAAGKLGGLLREGADDDGLSRSLSGLRLSNDLVSGEKSASTAVSTTPEYVRALEARIPGSAEWIFATQGYKTWVAPCSEGESRVFWVHAPDGFGKTVLAGRIVEELLSAEDETPVAYFFCSHEDSEKRVTTCILRSWVEQLSGESGRKALEETPEEELWRAFGITLRSIGRCYLVLDALDECLDYDEAARSRTAGVRGVFLRKLLDVTGASDTGVRVCVVSRDVSDIRCAMKREHDKSLGSHPAIEFAAGPEDNAMDVKLFARSLVEEKLGEQSVELKEDLIESITVKSGGSMVWVRLAGAVLKPWMSEDQLKETSSCLPSGLLDLHKYLLGRVVELGKEERDRAKEILRWTLFAERPLNVRELTEALMIRDGDTKFPIERLPSPIDEGYVNSQILRLCGGLVEVRPQGSGPADWTLHIAHSSTKAFLTASYSEKEHEDLDKLVEFTFSDYHLSHGILAKTCLSYLMLEDIETTATYIDYHSAAQWPPSPSSTLFGSLPSYSLLHYSAKNWSRHALQNSDYDAALYPRISAALKHPRKARKYNIPRAAYHSPEWHSVLFFRDHAPALATPLSPLDYSVRFGITHGVKVLLRNTDPTAHAEIYVRALWIAVYYHQPHLVTLLLSKGANVNATGNLGSAIKFGSALHIAVKLSFTSIAQTLLSHGADANAHVGEFGNILNTAVAAGNERMVELLLDAGANLADAPSRCGSALVLAVAMRRNGIVDLLLDRGADVGAQCGAFGDVLCVAADGGDEGMVGMLLDHGAKVNAVGGFHGTALHAAAAKGHAGVVRLLIERGADVDVQAGHHGSVLAAARESRCEEVLEVLAEMGAR